MNYLIKNLILKYYMSTLCSVQLGTKEMVNNGQNIINFNNLSLNTVSKLMSSYIIMFIIKKM